MIDSKAKGARIELQARDELRKLTGLSWERIPASGSLNESHGLKGDLYVPQCFNTHCIEVKVRKDSVLNHTILTSKNSELVQFWNQTLRQAEQVDQLPLLIFKWDRSKFFVLFTTYSLVPFYSSALKIPNKNYKWFYYNPEQFYIAKLEDFIKNEKIEWIVDK